MWVTLALGSGNCSATLSNFDRRHAKSARAGAKFSTRILDTVTWGDALRHVTQLSDEFQNLQT